MFRAKLNILMGIVLISSTAGVAPQVAYAEPVCSSGVVASGATQTQTFTLDASMRSHFTLEASEQDVALEVVDDANNVACATSLPNPGYQTCGWMPVDGAVYTARIMRPLPTNVANASESPIPVADDASALYWNPAVTNQIPDRGKHAVRRHSAYANKVRALKRRRIQTDAGAGPADVDPAFTRRAMPPGLGCYGCCWRWTRCFAPEVAAQ